MPVRARLLAATVVVAALAGCAPEAFRFERRRVRRWLTDLFLALGRGAR